MCRRGPSSARWRPGRCRCLLDRRSAPMRPARGMCQPENKPPARRRSLRRPERKRPAPRASARWPRRRYTCRWIGGGCARAGGAVRAGRVDDLLGFGGRPGGRNVRARRRERRHAGARATVCANRIGRWRSRAPHTISAGRIFEVSSGASLIVVTSGGAVRIERHKRSYCQDLTVSKRLRYFMELQLLENVPRVS